MAKANWLYGALTLSVLVIAWLSIGDYFTTTFWVGHTDLTILVSAIDQSTGLLIPNATIEIRSEDDVSLPSPAQLSSVDRLYHATMAGDPSGTTAIYHGETLTSGAIRPITFTNTYHVKLPGWIINVSAPGYRLSDDELIQSFTHSKLVRTTSPRKCELRLQIFVRRIP